jgi:hypothetical protein
MHWRLGSQILQPFARYPDCARVGKVLVNRGSVQRSLAHPTYRNVATRLVNLGRVDG